MFTILFVLAAAMIAAAIFAGDVTGGGPWVVGNLTNEQLSDLWNTTMREVGRGDMDYALKHQTYLFMDTVLASDKVEVTGTAIQGRISLDDVGNARFIDPYEPAEPAVKSTTWPFAIPWRYMEVHSSIERHEILENMGAARLYDLAKLRKAQAIMDLCNLAEESWFSTTAPELATTKALWGLATWAGKYEDTVDGAGFYGGLPAAGWSDLAGIAPCTTGSGTAAITGGQERWRSWCGGYKGFNARWIDRMLECHVRVKFKGPLLATQITQVPFDRFRVYTSITAYLQALSYQRKRGDDNGAELAVLSNGTLTIMGTPILQTDLLDADTDDPFYFVNRAMFVPVVLAGDYLREDVGVRDRLQHDVMTDFTNLTVNMKCRNRRQAVAVVNKY